MERSLLPNLLKSKRQATRELMTIAQLEKETSCSCSKRPMIADMRNSKVVMVSSGNDITYYIDISQILGCSEIQNHLDEARASRTRPYLSVPGWKRAPSHNWSEDWSVECRGEILERIKRKCESHKDGLTPLGSSAELPLFRTHLMLQAKLSLEHCNRQGLLSDV